jgi:hypothetical protein
MNNIISTNLKYIADVSMSNNYKRQALSVTLEDKEDFERRLLYFHKYKKVVRLNMIAPKTNTMTRMVVCK